VLKGSWYIYICTWCNTDLLPVVVRLDKLMEDEVSQRKMELESQFVIGDTCSEEECGRF